MDRKGATLPMLTALREVANVSFEFAIAVGVRSCLFVQRHQLAVRLQRAQRATAGRRLVPSLRALRHVCKFEGIMIFTLHALQVAGLVCRPKAPLNAEHLKIIANRSPPGHGRY